MMINADQEKSHFVWPLEKWPYLVTLVTSGKVSLPTSYQ